MKWFEQTAYFANILTQHASITNSAGEQTFASMLEGLLRSWSYFADNPENLWCEATLDDAYPRSSVFALVRGSGTQTVILTGHFDVVSTSNYGQLEPLAFDPQALKQALIEQLKSSGTNSKALADLESGDFLPGRGLLDMKGGLAAGLSVLEQFSKQPEPIGNLLFIAVSDEEVASHGMKSVVRQLPDIAKRFSLLLTTAINLDAEVDQGDGGLGQSIFMGSVGKLLPVVLFLGRPTHAGAPHDGYSATLAAAEFVRSIEANPEFADHSGLESAPAPVVLYHRDMRVAYDVTTPSAVWCAVNVLSYRRSPTEVLAWVCEAAKAACQKTTKIQQQRANRVLEDTVVPVLTLEDLARDATTQTASNPETTADLMLALAQALALEAPAVVVGFAPVYYPRSSIADQPWLIDLLTQEAQKFYQETGVAVALRPAFPGISDMSFLSAVDSSSEQALVQKNTFAARLLPDLQLPTINIGPWGRDYHQKLERIYTPYSFEALPELLWRVTRRILEVKAEKLERKNQSATRVKHG